MDYRQAMDQLKGMFPHFDDDVLHIMLEQSQGHLEMAIESLLAMTAAAEQDDDAGAPPSSTAAAAAAPGGPLPASFLSLDHTPEVPLGPDGLPVLSQVDADEEYAKMLQEKIFMEELQNNPDLLRALEEDERAAMGLAPAPQRSFSSSASRASAAPSAAGPSLGDRVKNASSSTKDKIKSWWQKVKGGGSKHPEVQYQYSDISTARVESLFDEGEEDDGPTLSRRGGGHAKDE